MKIWLTMNISQYAPPHGGAEKSTRLVLEALAARGHTVRVFAASLGQPPRATQDDWVAALEALGLHGERRARSLVFELNRVEVHVATERGQLHDDIAEQLSSFAPDVILVTSEDLAQQLLSGVLAAARSPVICIVRTLSLLPFGPGAFIKSAERAARLREVTRFVVITDSGARYLKEWGGLDSVVFVLQDYGSPPFPDMGGYRAEFVTMINPCAVKGIDIFVALARRFPEIAFAAVPGWGTTPRDLHELRQLPNMHLLDWTAEIDSIFARTRALMVPSLWYETRGRVVVEAMLRRIPCIASDQPGIREAKLGTDFLIPVRLIEDYGEAPAPLARVPEQDITPWADALHTLLSSEDVYNHHSAAAATAARDWVAAQRNVMDEFESYLTDAVMRYPAR